MPGITYMLQFTRRDRENTPEVIEYMALADAWEAFRLFAEPDSSEMYICITLIARNWEEGTESPIATMAFAEPYSF